MKYVLLGIITLLTSACGPVRVSMPDDVQPYYHEFYEIVGYEKETSGAIVIVSESMNDAGFCNRPLVGDWSIKLNQKIWTSMTSKEKRTLVYHELSHCVLLLSHSHDTGSYMFRSPYLYFNKIDLDTQLRSYLISH